MQYVLPIAVFLNDIGAVSKVRCFLWGTEGKLSTDLQRFALQDKSIVVKHDALEFVSRFEDLTLEELHLLGWQELHACKGLTVVDSEGVVREDVVQVAVLWSDKVAAFEGIFVDWRGVSVSMSLHKMLDLSRKVVLNLGYSVWSDTWIIVDFNRYSGLQYATEEKRTEVEKRLTTAELYNLPYKWSNYLGELILTEVNSESFIVPDIFDAVDIGNDSTLKRLCANNIDRLRLRDVSLKELVVPRVMRELFIRVPSCVKFVLPEEIIPMHNKPALVRLGSLMSILEVDFTEIDQSKYILTSQEIILRCPKLRKAVFSVPDLARSFYLREALSLEYIKFVRRVPFSSNSCCLPLLLKDVRGEFTIDWQVDVKRVVFKLRLVLCNASRLVVIRLKSCTDMVAEITANRDTDQWVLFVLDRSVTVDESASGDWGFRKNYRIRDVYSKQEEERTIESIKSLVAITSPLNSLPTLGFIVRKCY